MKSSLDEGILLLTSVLAAGTDVGGGTRDVGFGRNTRGSKKITVKICVCKTSIQIMFYHLWE
jgi:hypothetical protein